MFRAMFKTFGLVLSWLVGVFIIGRRQPKVAILFYHSVSNKEWKHSISPDTFEKQVKYLKKHFEIIDLKDVYDFILGKKSFTRDVVAITFDDGYQDTFTIAYHILKKHDIKATVFLTTNLEERQKFNNLERPTEHGIKDTLDIFSIESHGHNHIRYDSSSKESILLDIKMSKDKIEDMTHRVSSFFAYPYGASSEVARDIILSEFKLGFGIQEGFVKSGDSHNKVKRIQVDKTISWLQFKLRLTDAVEVNRKLVDILRKKYGKN